MSALLWLLAQAVAPEAEVPPAPPVAPLDALHGVVVNAIRNCGQRGEEIIVCSRDRGFAEGEAQRIPKIKKPKVPESGAGVKVQVTAGPPPPPKREW